jgi:hypothetical protein
MTGWGFKKNEIQEKRHEHIWGRAFSTVGAVVEWLGSCLGKHLRRVRILHEGFPLANFFETQAQLKSRRGVKSS